jgi:hypothetical protein
VPASSPGWPVAQCPAWSAAVRRCRRASLLSWLLAWPSAADMLTVALSPCDDHLVSVVDIRVVFRALAEVRNKDFYSLWVLLTRSWPKPLPKIEFRIYPVAESTDTRVVVHVAATRPDGTKFDWGLAVTTWQDSLIIEGSVDMRTPGDDGSEVFSKSGETTDPEQAANLICVIASEVCSQREWLSQDSERGERGA